MIVVVAVAVVETVTIVITIAMELLRCVDGMSCIKTNPPHPPFPTYILTRISYTHPSPTPPIRWQYESASTPLEKDLSSAPWKVDSILIRAGLIVLVFYASVIAQFLIRLSVYDRFVSNPPGAFVDLCYMGETGCANVMCLRDLCG